MEIDGEAYWDGGFSSNPPLLPLVEHCRVRDLLLVQLSPSEVAELPVTAPAIRGRMRQIVFNAPQLGAESAGRPHRELLVQLREAGRAAADGWLRARALAQLPAADARAA